MVKSPSFCLLLRLIFTFIILSHVNVLAKPASLVLKDSFGSDPYGKLAMHETKIIAIGKDGAGRSTPSTLLDILEYKDQQFNLLSQYHFQTLTGGQRVYAVVDVRYFNNFWLILVDTNQGTFLLSALLTDNKLEMISVIELNYSGSSWAELVSGANNQLYVADKVYQGLVVKHIDVDEDGSLTLVSSKAFGVPSEFTYYPSQFSVAFDNNTLFLSNNQRDKQAVIYRLPLDEQGIPLEAVPMQFDAAQAEYKTMAVQGDYMFLSYVYWGFQVVKMEQDNLEEVYNFVEDSSFTALLFKDDHLVAVDTFGEIDVFDISNMDSIQHIQQYSTGGFRDDGLLQGNTLIISRDAQGIGALELNLDGSLTSIANFTQSGEISDFTKNEGYLVTSAMDNALNIWSLPEDDMPQIIRRFETTNQITGVDWQDNDILLMNSGNLERHLADNILANIDSGEHIGGLRTSGRDGQILPLKNGFLAKYFNYLSFFSNSLTQLDEIELSNPTNQSGSVHTPLVDNNILYVPTNTPGQVIIYDISDLANVVELGRIERGLYYTAGNLAKKGNILYVPSYANESGGIALYDVSDSLNPQNEGNIILNDTYSYDTVVHVYGNFLLILTQSGYLFDINNPAQPILIDENPDLSTNGISAMFDGHLYAVPYQSAGRIQNIYVNLAPQLADMTIELDEDIPVDIALLAVDGEKDDITYTVITPPELGTLEVTEASILRYTPPTDFSGVETSEVKGEDQYGGSNTFVLTLNIKAINDAPQLLDSALTTQEDQILDVQLQANDVDSQSLIFELVAESLYGTATLSESGVLSYTPSTDFFGVDKLEVKVSDELNASITKTIDVAVTPVNDVPIYTGETTVLGDEDIELEMPLSGTDIENEQLEYSVMLSPEGWVAEINEDMLRISPSQDDNGTFQILVGISDGTDVLEQSINVVLAPVNDPPIITQSDFSVIVTSGSQVSSVLPISDIDNDELTYTLVEQANKGIVTLTDTGFIYQANAGTTGTDTFLISVSDADGESVDVPVTVNISVKVEPASSSASGGGSINFFLGCLLLFIYLSRASMSQQRVNRNLPRQ
jgi:hypothetical protein